MAQPQPALSPEPSVAPSPDHGRAPFFATVPQDDRSDPHEVRGILRARARRAKFFSSRLFADPAWDMLLELYAAQLEQQRISVSGLCIASRVPATTGLRWIGALLEEGLINRRCDPLDKRRIYVALSESGFNAMSAYFQGVPGVLRVL